MYGAFIPPKTSRPASAAASRKNLCVAHVMIDQRAHLLAAFRRIQAPRRRVAPDNSRCSISCSNAAAKADEAASRRPFSVRASNDFRHDCKPAAHAGEPAVLGKTAKLNRALARARNFENRMRNLRLAKCTPRTRHRRADSASCSRA